MWGKTSKAIRAGAAVVAARREYASAKAAGEVSITRELAAGQAAPGATWLMVRAAMVPVVSAMLSGLVQAADEFVAADLAALIGPGVIDGAALALVAGGMVWSVLDVVRSSARLGLFRQGPSDQP